MTNSKIATVGMFDGVHAGHRHVVGYINEIGRQRGLESAVFTFSNHPLTVIKPELAPPLLTTPEEKTVLLDGLGVRHVFVSEFTNNVRLMTSRDFIRHLRDSHSVAAMVIGFDNRIGCDRETDFDGYCRIGREENIDIIRAPELKNGLMSINSTSIRKRLLEGDVATAAEMLCTPYRLTGKVISGKHIGRTIGFPTANIVPSSPEKLIPGSGVYACEARLADGPAFPAMVNIGRRPTVDRPDAPVTIEAHLIGYDGDLYGSEITLEFIARLRDEKKFDTLAELQSQLDTDRKQALKLTSKI